MKVHFFTKGPFSTASSRQRAFLIAEYLRNNKIESIVHTPSLLEWGKASFFKKIKIFFKYLKIFLSIKKNEIIFLQRTIYNKYFFVLILVYKVLFKRKIIFDFDDACYLTSWRSYLKTRVLSQISDAVIVGSHSLKKWAQQYNQNVFLVPTSIPFYLYKKYSVYYREKNKKVVIGWIGSGRAHYRNLQVLVPVFKELLKENLPFKFVLIGGMGEKKIHSLFSGIEGLDFEIIDELNWSDPSQVPSHIQKFDIGVFPYFEDSEWNRGKCAFKAIEYMGCAVPTVAQAIGENKFLIEHKKTGFLVNSKEEWVKVLKSLILDENLREKIGKAGQEKVKKEYSLEGNIPKIIKILKSL